VPARVTLSVGGPAGAAAIGDLNRDGRNDIVARAGNAVSVFLGDGRGGFERSARSPFGAGENPSDLVLADFNRDGRLDVAVANHETDYLSVLIGDGNGALAEPSRVPVPSRPHLHGIAAGDFNADGHPDLAVESWEEDTVLVVHGNGRGTFAAEPARLAVGPKPYWKLRAGDLNADGSDDLVTTNTGGNSVSVVCSGLRGLSQAATTFPIAPSPFAVAIGDVTGDRIPDLAVAHRWGSLDPKFDGLTVLIGKGECAFAPSSDSPLKVGASPTAVAIGDVDADGIGDIATANMASDDVTVLLARESGWRPAPGSPFSVGPGPSAVVLGNLNGDGRADIVISTGSDVTVLIPSAGW
jgi:hypothetical protein